MAREVQRIYRLTGELVADAPVCVADGREGTSEDITCVRDGRRQLIIPGTTLAGVLRHRLGPNHLWGDDLDPAGPRPRGHDDRIVGSAVWVSDCVANDATVEHRDGVGIDRRTGTAAAGVLYRRQVVAAGTRFTLQIDVEDTTPTAPTTPARELFDTIVAALHQGLPVGGATTRGLGTVRLATHRTCALQVATPAGILDLLADGLGAPIQVTGRAPTTEVTFEVPWRPTGPLLSKVAVNGLVDAVPLTGAGPDGESVRLIIPGSSVKGVLRAHAERIMRTMTIAPSQAPEQFLDQTGDGALPMVETLFGRAARSTPDRHGRKGLIAVTDCLSDPVTGWDQILESVLTTPGIGVDGPSTVQPSGQPGNEESERTRRARAVAKARAGTTGSALSIIDHVAIDRWSGAAVPGRLFSSLAPTADSKWTPMRVRIDLTRLAGRPATARAAVVLVALLLRDLCDGDIPVGHGTTRGYGQITADPSHVRIHVDNTAEPVLAALDGRSLADLLAPPADLQSTVGELEAAWATARCAQRAWSRRRRRATMRRGGRR